MSAAEPLADQGFGGGYASRSWILAVDTLVIQGFDNDYRDSSAIFARGLRSTSSREICPVIS